MIDIIRQFDQSFKFHSLWTSDGEYPIATQHKPHSFTAATEWIDMPNVRNLMKPRGVDDNGEKRKPGKQYGSIQFWSKIEPTFLVSAIGPILDKADIQISIKALQQLRCSTDFAIIGVSTAADLMGTTEIVQEAFEREIKDGLNSKGPISRIDEVPPFVLVRRQLRLFSVKKWADLNLTNLELYDRTLRQAFHLQTSSKHKSTWEILIQAVEQSKILQKLLGVKAHFVSIPMGNVGEASRIVFHRKAEAHMAYQANTASLELGELRFLHRRVKVVMQPIVDENGNEHTPQPPFKYTSLFRELMRLTTSDGRQLIDSIVPIRSGPNSGMVLVVFRQHAESEAIVCAIARSPTAWIGHVCSSVLGYSIEGCVDPLLRSCDEESRLVWKNTKWDADTWTVVTPFATISDTFADSIADDGYTLPSSCIVNVPKASTQIAIDDMERVKKELGLRDDMTLATRDGVSCASHTTTGDGSLRSITSTELHRNFKQRCAAEAKEREQKAKQRFGKKSEPSAQQGEPAPSKASGPGKNSRPPDTAGRAKGPQGPK